MIAACPKCRTRYRVDGARLGAEGVRLRCTSCQTVFRARAPAQAAAPTAPGPAPEPPAAHDPRRRVLVGDADTARAKATRELLEAAGLEAVCAHDGVEALLTLQRTLPRAVVLDAELPRMLGSEICELVKRNESLRSTWVVLVAQRQAGSPGQPYGADAHVERSELPRALLPVLSGFGLPVHPPAPAAPQPPPPAEATAEAAPRSEPAPQAAPASAPAAAAPDAPPAGGGELDELRAKAERLARIIVSDIVLYNEQKFAAAVAGGDVLRGMAAELDEGRALLAGRIDEGVRATRDFVAEELLRVARSRGAS